MMAKMTLCRTACEKPPCTPACFERGRRAQRCCCVCRPSAAAYCFVAARSIRNATVTRSQTTLNVCALLPHAQTVGSLRNRSKPTLIVNLHSGVRGMRLLRTSATARNDFCSTLADPSARVQRPATKTKQSLCARVECPATKFAANCCAKLVAKTACTSTKIRNDLAAKVAPDCNGPQLNRICVSMFASLHCHQDV